MPSTHILSSFSSFATISSLFVLTSWLLFDFLLFYHVLLVSLGKYHTASSSMMENEEPAQLKTEAETVEHILRHEKSAAAILYQLKIQHETQASDIQLTKDVLGVVATLGKVDDDNLSRLVSILLFVFLPFPLLLENLLLTYILV